MKIRIGRSRLLDGLKKVQSASNGKSGVQIYANVNVVAKDGKISLTTTDGDITLHTVVDAEIDEPGEITIPMAQMFASVNKMVDGEVTINVTGEKIKLEGGSYKINMVGLPSSEFPSLPKNKSGREFKLNAKRFVDMIRKTAYAQSIDGTRIALNGMFVELQDGKMSCVATDGRRLAVAECTECEEIGDDKGSEPFGVIIPTRSVSICQRFLDVEGDVIVSSYGSQIAFVVTEEKGFMFTKLIDVAYPNYKQVIPKNDMNVATADRDLLLSALDRMSIMESAGEVSVKMIFDGGMLRMEIKSDISGSDANDEVPIKYDGKKVEILFNPKYVMEPLRASSSDEIAIKLTDGTHPAMIDDALGSYFCVLMPMRLN